MGDSIPGTLPGHMQLTDFDISLEPGTAQHPIRPVVQGLRLRVSARGLQTLMQALVDEADRRAPVGIKLKGVSVGPQGIELFVRMAKSIFSSDLSTRLVLSAPGGKELRVELTDTDMPAWVPLDMLLDEAAKRGGDGVRRDPGTATRSCSTRPHCWRGPGCRAASRRDAGTSRRAPTGWSSPSARAPGGA